MSSAFRLSSKNRVSIHDRSVDFDGILSVIFDGKPWSSLLSNDWLGCSLGGMAGRYGKRPQGQNFRRNPHTAENIFRERRRWVSPLSMISKTRRQRKKQSSSPNDVSSTNMNATDHDTLNSNSETKKRKASLTTLLRLYQTRSFPKRTRLENERVQRFQRTTFLKEELSKHEKRTNMNANVPAEPSTSTLQATESLRRRFSSVRPMSNFERIHELLMSFHIRMRFIATIDDFRVRRLINHWNEIMKEIDEMKMKEWRSWEILERF